MIPVEVMILKTKIQGKFVNPIPSLSAPAGKSLPDTWRAEVESQLANEEEILAWLEIDLDARLHFTQGLVVVTNRRLLAKGVEETAWRDWTYRKGLALQRHDHAGVGSLELHDDEARLACWRYTLGHNTSALRLVEHFEQQLAGFLAGHPGQPSGRGDLPQLQGAAPAGPGRVPHLHPGNSCPALDVDPVPSVAFRQAL